MALAIEESRTEAREEALRPSKRPKGNLLSRAIFWTELMKMRYAFGNVTKILVKFGRFSPDFSVEFFLLKLKYLMYEYAYLFNNKGQK